MKANTALQGNEYIGNTGLKGAEDAGSVLMTGAGATAAGQVGQANAWTGALSQIGGDIMSATKPASQSMLMPSGYTPSSPGAYSLPMPVWGATLPPAAPYVPAYPGG